MEDDKNVIQSSVMGEVWTSEIEKIKRTSNIDIDVYDTGCGDEKKRVYCVKRSGDGGSKTSNTKKDNNSKNYQVKIVIDIESGKLEEVDFGELVGDGITIDKIEEIQKSINICKEENGRVSYGRIAPIRDISAILSLVKEYCYHKSVLTTEAYYNPYKMGFTKNELDEYVKTNIIKEFNKSGIRFLCFTEDENSNPQTKRDRFNKIAWKAIEEDSIECVSVMYSLLEISPPTPPPLPLSTSSSSLISSAPSAPLPPPLPSSQISPQQHSSNLKTPHSRHSIVAMAYKEDEGGKIIIKTFDSSGASYLNDNMLNEDGTVLDSFKTQVKFLDFSDNYRIMVTTERPQKGTNCSYWSEGDLIVVFRKHLQEKGIKKGHLTDTELWDKEVLNEIKTEVKDVLMKTIVKTNSNTQPLPPPLPPPQNIPTPKPPQSTSSGGKEAVSEEEAPKEQVKKQMQNVFSELLGKMEASDVSSTTPSPQQTQLNTLQNPLNQPTVPRSKSSPLP